MEVHERLKQLRKELKLTQSELSQILGIAPTTYAMIETGRRTLKAGYVKILKYQYNVNEDWLLKGEGEMFYISPTKAYLIEQFEKMSPKIQQYYLKLSDDLIVLGQDLEKH